MRGERFRKFYEDISGYVQMMREYNLPREQILNGIINRLTEVDERTLTGKQLRKIFNLVNEPEQKKSSRLSFKEMLEEKTL